MLQSARLVVTASKQIHKLIILPVSQIQERLVTYSGMLMRRYYRQITICDACCVNILRRLLISVMIMILHASIDDLAWLAVLLSSVLLYSVEEGEIGGLDDGASC